MLNLKYYFSLNLYNFVFSLILGVISGFPVGIMIFCSFGILVGLIGFRYFSNNEYYIYYNMGLTKFQLVKTDFFGNLAISYITYLQMAYLNVLNVKKKIRNKVLLDDITLDF